MTDSYLSVAIPEEDVFAAIAEETSLTDADVDALEAEALKTKEESLALTLALKLGRVGRATSSVVLALLRRGLINPPPTTLLMLDLAEELLRPSPRLERAESGYVFERSGYRLFVEDPLAAHWHRRGRLGPPLRFDPSQAPRVLDAANAKYALEWLSQGEILLVGFDPSGLGLRAPRSLLIHPSQIGFAPDFRESVRFSEIESFGWWANESIAYVPKGRPPIVLPNTPRISASNLFELLSGWRSRSARSA